MEKKQSNQPDYGNWVSISLIKKIIIIFFIFLCTTIILFVVPIKSNIFVWIFRIINILLTSFFVLAIFYFLLSRKQFSYKGGKIQEKVLDALIRYINFDGNGEILDIGCGNGALVNKLSKKYNQANIIGVDNWGKTWNFNKEQCLKNAKLENTLSNTKFINASASKLPF